MDITIGSFNVLNLNAKEKDKDDDFKEAKCKKIAELIDSSKFDIVALQEIQTDDAVKRIVHYLNGNDHYSPYDYCHCASLYGELNDAGLLNRNGSKFKSDYGFIWNKQKVQLYCDEALYKALDDKTNEEWQHFLEKIADILITAYEELTSQGGKQSGLFSKLPQGEDFETHKDKLLAVLHSTLRPPLIACFKPASWYGALLHEIRIINTHTQWSKGKSDEKSAKKIRLEEMRFIQGKLHSEVNTLRTGTFNSIYTVIAGDFNMSKDDVSEIYKSESEVFDGHKMMTVQDAKSTCKWNEEKQIFEYKSNYDHFAFEEERIWPLTQEVATVQANKKNFLIGDEEKPVSDHIPIKIKLTF